MNGSRTLRLLCAWFALLWVCALPAQAEEDFLPVEKAFPVQAEQTGPQALTLRWTVAPGYYLYRDRLSVSAQPEGLISGLDIPRGKTKYDETFRKEVETLRGEVVVQVKLAQAASAFTLVVQSQGCADAGLCYPPNPVTFTFPLAKGLSGWLHKGPTLLSPDPAPAYSDAAAPGSSTLPDAQGVDEAGVLAQRLKGLSLWATVAVFMGLGVLLAFTPCVLPMVPILSSAVVGDQQKRALSLSLVYVVSMSLVYAAVGVAAGLTGQGLIAAMQKPAVIIVFALVLGVFGISMLGAFELQLPSGLQSRIAQRSSRLSGGKYGQVALMGALSAVLVGPCVAPPLAGALVFLGQTGDWVRGGAALFALGLGMGVPVLAFAVGADRLLPRRGGWMESVKKVFGALLIALGLYTAAPVLSTVAFMALVGAYAIFMACMVGLSAKGEGLWPVLRQACALALLLIGMLEWTGLAAGGRDVLQPLKTLGGASPAPAGHAAALPFERVPAAQVLARLQASSQPVMLDFYADWCVSCKEMEALTFPDPAVRERLNAVTWLQVDVTANSAQDQALLKQFGLFGPPAILFFKAGGQPIEGGRVIGFQNAQKFARSLDAVLPPR